MQYVTDPKSENRLSVLGFGCMRFPLDREKTEKLIVEAVNSGVNYFDTAFIYGSSEATLGTILHKNGLRDSVFIATKLPHQKCKEYGDFDKLFQAQLARLKTSHIDYYLIHNLSDIAAWRRLCEMGIESWVSEKKASGLIRQLGFSFHGTQKGFVDLIGAYDWDFCQIQYNYMDENYQAGRSGLRSAYEKGMPVIVMEPLLGGKLATGLPPKAMQLFKQADQDSTAASWALRWLWNQPEVTVVLSGMNSMEQLGENVKTAGAAMRGMMTDGESSVIDSVTVVLREAYKIPCTGCNYCMPCPQTVNIPGCFAAYNTSYAMGFFSGIVLYLTGTGANRPEMQQRPKFCIKCGACEKQCPQHIEIIKQLEAVRRRMEPFWFNAVIWLIQKITG